MKLFILLVATMAVSVKAMSNGVQLHILMCEQRLPTQCDRVL